MRFATLLLVLAVGCSAIVRDVGSADLNAAIAAEAGKALVRAAKVVAPPKPVVPAGVCERCAGKGYIGDESAIRVVCPACKGSGKTACPTGKCGVQR